MTEMEKDILFLPWEGSVPNFQAKVQMLSLLEMEKACGER